MAARASGRHISPKRRRQRVAVRTTDRASFNVRCDNAGVRERSGTRRGVDAAAAAAPESGIGFAPEMIAPNRDLPRISFHWR
jgi:hypothetical protein